jgi:hypothetical protein
VSSLELLAVMELPPRDLLITGLRLQTWGKDTVLDCLYDPNLRKLFQLVFRKCKSLQLELLNEIGERDIEANVIGISLGKDKFREQANIRTTLFDFYVLYDHIVIVKDW